MIIGMCIGGITGGVLTGMFGSVLLHNFYERKKICCK